MVIASIDIGSTTIKVVIFKEDNHAINLITTTGANPKLKAQQLFKEAQLESGLKAKDISCVVSTGYGRRSIDFSDHTVTEITACAKHFTSLDKEDKTIIDIGGQDSKVITIEDGLIKDFAMNDKCAAGTGKFLEIMANMLEMNLEEFSIKGDESKNPIDFNSTCAIFAQSELISALAGGKEKKDIIKGLHISLAKRISSLVKSIESKDSMFFCGGGAKNRALKKSVENELNREIILAEDPQFVVAKGAALWAKQKFF